METTPDFAGLFVKMVAGLLLVLALAIILIRYILPKSRIAGRLWGKGTPEGVFSILNRFPLEPKKNLYLVKVINRYFLLGSAENSLNLISEINPAEGEKIEKG